MRSMWEITCLVIDGKISTEEQAQVLLDEESEAIAKALHITPQAARAKLLDDLNDTTLRLAPPTLRTNFVNLFHLPRKDHD